MSAVGQLVALAGVAIIILAAVGLLRFKTPYARIHAAGKASPVAFIVVAIAAAPAVGWAGSAKLLLAASALLLTLPLAVHLLFRAVHASAPEYDPPTDELTDGARPAPEH